MLNGGVKELVVGGLGPRLAGKHLAEVCAAHAHGLREEIMVARSGGVAMCFDAAENPMMYVPWWVNIGWFHAMCGATSRSS